MSATAEPDSSSKLKHGHDYLDSLRRTKIVRETFSIANTSSKSEVVVVESICVDKQPTYLV